MNNKPKTLTQTQFAELCGVGLDYIGTYIKRKKIICNNRGRIDPANELNALFMQKRINSIDTDQTGDKKQKMTLVELERALKVSELEKRNKEIELLTLKKQKIEAEVIPLELTMSVFQQHNHSILTTFKIAAERYVLDISHRARLSLEESAQLKALLIEHINHAITEAHDLTKKQVGIICKEYSQKRAQGEKK